MTNVHTCMHICTYFCDLGPFGTHPPLCCTKVYMALLCFRGKYRHPPPPLGCTKVYMLLLCFEKYGPPPDCVQ